MNPRYATPLETYEGGGSQFQIPDGVEFTITKLTCEHFTMGSDSYAGFSITAQVGDEEYTEQLFAGRSELVDVEGGKHLIPGQNNKFHGDQYCIPKNSPAGLFQDSLLKVGFPWDVEKWDESGYKQLEGHTFLSSRIPVLDKSGKPKTNKNGYAMSNLSVAKYIESSSGGGTKSATSKGAAASTNGNVSDKEKAAIEETIMSQLDTPKKKTELMVTVKQAHGNDAMRLLSTDWATSSDRPWKVEKGVFSI
jgi:hypothetical protein